MQDRGATKQLSDREARVELADVVDAMRTFLDRHSLRDTLPNGVLISCSYQDVCCRVCGKPAQAAIKKPVPYRSTGCAQGRRRGTRGVERSLKRPQSMASDDVRMRGLVCRATCRC